MRPIRAAVLLAVLAVPGMAPAADPYHVDPSHSNVDFRIRHLISTVSGRFSAFSGTILLDTTDMTKSSVTFVIDAKSIDTANAKRDEHLRSADFFDVEKYPEIVFESSSIAKTGENAYAVTGNFTMHGVTKPITVPVTYLGSMTGPRGTPLAGFVAEVVLNRKDFGIVWNRALDAGGAVLGDEVTCRIALEAAVRKEAPAAPVPAK